MFTDIIDDLFDEINQLMGRISSGLQVIISFRRLTEFVLLNISVS